jgi:drug/metabolite transporter, DME family
MSVSTSSSSAASSSSSSSSVAVRRVAGPLLCLALAGVLWGTGGLAGTLLGRTSGLSPAGVAAARLLAGGGLIVAFRLARRQRLPRGRAAWTRITVAGLLAGGFQATYFYSIAFTSVSLATLITIGGTPVLVQAAELATGRQRPGRAGLLTLTLALAGLGLLIGLPGGGYSEGALLAGTGFALLSAAGFAALTVLGADPVPGLDDLAMTGYGSLLGGLAVLPLALAVGVSGGTGLHYTAEAFGLLAGLAVGPTAVGYILYYRGLRSASPTTAALMSLLEPLTAAVLGVLVLGDRLGPAGIAGAALLGVSVVRTVRADSVHHAPMGTGDSKYSDGGKDEHSIR